MILSLILWSLAAALNALMDTLKDHFGVSIFKNLNPEFWNPVVSWNKSYNLFGSWGGSRWISLDAWHISKFLMLGCLAGAVVTSTLTIPWIIGLSLIWGIIFELFYSYLLKSN